jgi:hypothetical protein
MATAAPRLSPKAMRRAVLGDNGLTHADIVRWVKKERGRKIARQTVTAVLAGEFSNRDVEDAVCALTGAARGSLFPPKDG